MEQKPLIETNPYLRDPEKFRKALEKQSGQGSSPQ